MHNFIKVKDSICRQRSKLKEKAQKHVESALKIVTLHLNVYITDTKVQLKNSLNSSLASVRRLLLCK